MNPQQNIITTANQSKSFFKDDQVNDLMKSIQNKLQMLAGDESIGSFQASKLSSPKRQCLTVTDEKKNIKRMNIQDLETSHRRQTRDSPSRLGESRILSRINQMEHFYMDKIQELSTKVAGLQFEVQNLTKVNHEFRNENVMIKQQLSRKQKQQNQIVNRKLQELKSELIQKFAKEAEQHFELHIKEMKSINEQLLEEKGKRKYFQQEAALLKNEKNNLQQFYTNLLQNHRNMIKLDIIKSEKNNKQHSCHGAIGPRGDQEDSSTTKKKTRKKQNEKDKASVSRRSEEMTKQQMIPFLAKGIQQLKDKLKIK